MPEPHLNGAYYGPSIPPPPSSKTYHRPGHGGGGGSNCCCCNPFTCCCKFIFNCICTCIFQIICTLLVIVAVIGLVLWFILRPNKVNFHVSNASLTQFDLTNTNNTNTLHYNLNLNLSIRNPNKRIGIYYDAIEARAFYHGQNFSGINLDPFYQGHKNTSDLNLVFKGQYSGQLGSENYYNGEKELGIYEIGLRVYMRIRLKFWWIKSKKIKPMIKCDLKVPFKSNGTFERTQCHLDW